MWVSFAILGGSPCLSSKSCDNLPDGKKRGIALQASKGKGLVLTGFDSVSSWVTDVRRPKWVTHNRLWICRWRRWFPYHFYLDISILCFFLYVKFGHLIKCNSEDFNSLLEEDWNVVYPYVNLIWLSNFGCPCGETDLGADSFSRFHAAIVHFQARVLASSGGTVLYSSAYETIIVLSGLVRILFITQKTPHLSYSSETWFYISELIIAKVWHFT